MLARKALAGTAGAPKEYVEDVFNTWVYTGSSSAQSFTNNIDLSTEGGLVWTKKRVDNSTSGDLNHILFDTARQVSGNDYFLSTNTALAQNGGSNYINFNSDGFGWTGSDTRWNYSGDTFVSWTFRKAEKFFDIVTYSGNSVDNRAISHNLGSTPGCVIVRRLSGDDWYVYHRSLTSASYGLRLNKTDSESSNTATVKSVSSTTFTVGTDGMVNVSGSDYVAYLFAHDAGGFGDAGSDNIISCGSFTTDGSGDATVTLNYEPQWLLLKPSSTTGNWLMVDTMRGWNVQSTGNIQRLFSNLNNAESAGGSLNPTATGFKTSSGGLSASTTYIYIAIRRGPMKTPTSGTDVFYPQAVSQADIVDSTGVPFPPDLVNTSSRNNTNRSTTGYLQFQFADRLRSLGTPNDTLSGSGCPALISSSTNAEATSSTYIQLKADGRNITKANGWSTYGDWIYYFMRRAPGFFDVVCYTGTGSATTFSHNLGVAPELIIVKRRSAAEDWPVYNSASGNTKVLFLNTTDATGTNSVYWNNTSPTSSVFSVGTSATVNSSGSTYVAYLFASLSGVSKVGSFTGNGSASQTINCGFTNGARFVMIKRTDGAGDWYVWDSARGIVSGNDPYLRLNSTATEVTNSDDIDSTSTGFIVNKDQNASLNENGWTYIYLAIA